jgi:hypothetical protein
MDALDAFYQEHHRCGVLDGDIEDGRVWMLCCKCGATFGESRRWRVIRYLERLYALPGRAVNIHPR